MQTDEALAVRLADGDELALRELLRRYEDRLARFLHRQTGGRDVDDLYQETWLRVVQHAERFDPQRRFSTWLFQIAVNLCRDWHRRPPPEPRPLDSETAAAELERSDAAIDAARLLSTLPDAQREVVVLRYYHDMTEDEVATILDIPRGTVKSRLHQAIARLAERVRGARRAAS
jgi:RNA polymerase sigma-70 factor (ECF subfamily)